MIHPLEGIFKKEVPQEDLTNLTITTEITDIAKIAKSEIPLLNIEEEVDQETEIWLLIIEFLIVIRTSS
jgi:hypothetical protein